MSTNIPVLNEKFEKIEELTIDLDLGPDNINVPVVHQVVKATLAGRRSGNASTKNRKLVRGGGAKPFKQKGTGRARQGSSRSPLLVGGGTAFGPQKRSFAQKVNKKVQLKAIHAVLADKFQAGKLTVVEDLSKWNKTKDLHKVVSERKLLPGLFVANQKDSGILKAANNLQFGDSLPVDVFSVYESVKFENLIIEKNALLKLSQRLVQK